MKIVLFDHPFYESANLGKLILSTSSIALKTISWAALYREAPPYYGYVALAPLRQYPAAPNVLGVVLISNQVPITNVFCEKDINFKIYEKI